MKKQLILMALTFFTLLTLTACGTSKEAKAVMEQIEELGEISLDSEEKLINTYSAFLELTEEQQAEVENADVLEEAMDEYNALAATDFINYLDTYTYENIDVLSTNIDSFWEYWNDDEKQAALGALGRCQMMEYFELQIRERLKSPDSFNLYSYEDSGAFLLSNGEYHSTVTIKYGATNSFGAEVTSVLSAIINYTVDIKNKTVNFTQFLCPELQF